MAKRDAQAACREEGGRRVTFPQDLVRSADLDGDGRADVVIDFHDVECDGAPSVYCGTEGCDLTIALMRPGGRSVTVFAQRVHTYEILPGEGMKQVRFRLHGGYCGRGGTDLCEKTVRITGKPFAFREPQ